jgi:aldehyde dehydrogenase (NAD+)
VARRRAEATANGKGRRMTTRARNLIAGEWIEGREAAPDINPSDTNDVVGEFPRSSAEEARRAIAAAKDAFPAWSRSTVQVRHDILKRVADAIMARKDEIGRILAREEGKTLAEGVGETVRAAQIFGFFAGECLRIAGDKLASTRPQVEVEVTREPLGVVGLITPWNFPIAIPAWKIAPALAYGNCVVLKPADLVPATAHALAEIIAGAGIPKGVFNLVMGRGSVVGDALLKSPDVAAISFTGSVPTGRQVARACIEGEPMKKVQLEMGGKNPLVVLDDADLKVAVDCAVNGAFFSTGQRCTASSRLVVTKGIHDRFVAAVTERIKSLVVDDALKPGTDIGPVVDEAQLDQDLAYLRIGRDEGATLHAGGERLNRAAPGFYLSPAIFTNVDRRMRIAREEIFGPVASVIAVKDYDEALDVANDTAFGLSAGICTTSLKYAGHFRRNAEAGMVMVNLPTAGVDYHVPFGGRKASSYGPREQGRYAAEFYTTVKTAYSFDLNESYVPKTRASE